MPLVSSSLLARSALL